MAFRVMRNKRNQRWTQRLHEIFQVEKKYFPNIKTSFFKEWDKNQTGYISLETMTEIYRIYKVKFKLETVIDKNYIFNQIR